MPDEQTDTIIEEHAETTASEDTKLDHTRVDQSGFVNSDGSLIDNWHNKLSDETLHNDPTLQRIKNVEALAKSYVHVRKQVPLEKIAIPTEKSSQVEWDAFYKAAGRPETPDDYNIQVAEDMPEGLYTKERITEAQGLFHKLGLSKKQVDALVAYDQEMARALIRAEEQREDIQRDEARAQLRGLWGQAYDQRIHWGNMAIAEGSSGDDQLKERIVDKFGDDPDFIRVLSNLGAKFIEAGAIQADNIPTPTDLQRQIDEEMAKPSYGTDYAQRGYTKQQHKAQVELVYKLRQKLMENTRTG